MRSLLVTLLLCLTATASTLAQHRFEFSLNGSVSAEALSLAATGLEAPTRMEVTHQTLRLIQKQLDEKEAAEAGSSPLEPLWKARFWKYLPKSGAQSMNSPMLDISEDDKFFAPAYLQVNDHQLQEEVRLSDQRVLSLFSP